MNLADVETVNIKSQLILIPTILSVPHPLTWEKSSANVNMWNNVNFSNRSVPCWYHLQYFVNTFCGLQSVEGLKASLKGCCGNLVMEELEAEWLDHQVSFWENSVQFNSTQEGTVSIQRYIGCGARYEQFHSVTHLQLCYTYTNKWKDNKVSVISHMANASVLLKLQDLSLTLSQCTPLSSIVMHLISIWMQLTKYVYGWQHVNMWEPQLVWASK